MGNTAALLYLATTCTGFYQGIRLTWTTIDSKACQVGASGPHWMVEDPARTSKQANGNNLATVGQTISSFEANRIDFEIEGDAQQ